MIFKEVKLRKDAWHYRLQNRMFGPLPTFNNFCPYFWITVFCVIVSPVFFSGVAMKWAFLRLPLVLAPIGTVLAPVGALLLGVLELVVEKLLSGIDNVLCLPLEAATIAGISDERLLDLYGHSRYIYMDRYQYSDSLAYQSLLGNADDRKTRKLWARMDHKFQAWILGRGDNWREDLKAAEARLVTKREDEARELAVREAVRAAAAAVQREADAKAAAERRQMLNNIVKYTKIAIPAMLGLLGLVALFGVYKFLVFLVMLPWLDLALNILKLPLYLLAGIWWVLKLPYRFIILFDVWQRLIIIATPIVGVVLVRLSRKCDLELPLTVFSSWLTKRRSSGLYRRIGSLFDAFGDFVDFMIEGFKMWKRDNCPQIIWEE
jgi:hypothetical protein